MLPGLSRSGVALATLLWLGVSAERAFELALLASLPAIALAIAIDAHRAGGGPLAVSGEGLVGGAIAFGIGLLALPMLRRAVEHSKLHWFAIYLVPLAAATIAWGYARP